MRRVVAVVLLLAIGGCTAVVYRNGISPRYTLYELNRAVEKHDFAKFERYADVYALCRLIDESLPRPSNIKIPVGTFAPQLLGQIKNYVRKGEPLARGIAPMFDAMEDGDITDDTTNTDGTRTITLAHDRGDVHLVMVRDGAVWRVARFDGLVIPPPPEGWQRPLTR